MRNGSVRPAGERSRGISVFLLLKAGIVIPRAYRAGMFPAGAFGVGVTVAELSAAPFDDGVVLPPGVVERPSRLGELLQVDLMTSEQKAAQLQRVVEAEAVLAAYRAELVVGLAGDRPASDNRQRGKVGAASGEWAAELLDADVSEFFPDELVGSSTAPGRRRRSCGSGRPPCGGGCRRPGRRWPTAGSTGRGRGR